LVGWPVGAGTTVVTAEPEAPVLCVVWLLEAALSGLGGKITEVRVNPTPMTSVDSTTARIMFLVSFLSREVFGSFKSFMVLGHILPDFWDGSAEFSLLRGIRP
jgi:hypothetical protein